MEFYDEILDEDGYQIRISCQLSRGERGRRQGRTQIPEPDVTKLWIVLSQANEHDIQTTIPYFPSFPSSPSSPSSFS